MPSLELFFIVSPIPLREDVILSMAAVSTPNILARESVAPPTVESKSLMDCFAVLAPFSSPVVSELKIILRFATVVPDAIVEEFIRLLLVLLGKCPALFA